MDNRAEGDLPTFAVVPPGGAARFGDTQAHDRSVYVYRGFRGNGNVNVNVTHSLLAYGSESRKRVGVVRWPRARGAEARRFACDRGLAVAVSKYARRGSSRQAARVVSIFDEQVLIDIRSPRWCVRGLFLAAIAYRDDTSEWFQALGECLQWNMRVEQKSIRTRTRANL